MSLTDAARIFAKLDSELWLITAADGSRRGGLIATFVVQASIVPELPRMLVGLAQHHFTWELIEASDAFAMHLIGEEHLDWVRGFGLQTGREADKLAGLNAQPGRTGSPVLTEALAWLDCRVEDRLDIGDRTVYLAEVVDASLERDNQPLTARRFRELAPPEMRDQLKEQMHHDIALDADAIRTWRSR